MKVEDNLTTVRTVERGYTEMKWKGRRQSKHVIIRERDPIAERIANESGGRADLDWGKYRRYKQESEQRRSAAEKINSYEETPVDAPVPTPKPKKQNKPKK